MLAGAERRDEETNHGTDFERPSLTGHPHRKINEGAFTMASGTINPGGGVSSTSDLVQNIYLPALQNTLALEKQAEQMIQRQLERYERYPEMIQLLRQHHGETEQQIQRLENILHQHGSDRSLLKDTVTQLAGNMGALFHSSASDEVLKNLYTNNALENYEIAAYRSLIVIAQEAGDTQNVSVLQQSLREEEKTAQAVSQHIETITRRFLELERSGQKADR
jgi:ferritin-like metal-binding protein YciE